MNRATLLALLLLLVLGAAFRVTPAFAVDGPFAGLELPEQLPTVIAAPGPPSMIGSLLILVTAVSIFLWRRAVGQGPLLALFPALVVSFHPAVMLASGSTRGCIELACLAVCVIGAWLMTFGRSAAAVLGAVLGFAAVLMAPSGAALAALFAFALAEAEPGLPGAAVFASLYGVARAFALPSLLGFAPDLAEHVAPFSPGEPPFVGPWSTSAVIATIGAVAGACVRFGVSWVAEAPASVVAGYVLCGVLVLGIAFGAPEKRFGGRAAPLLAGLSIVFLALEQGRRGLSVSAALTPAILLVALWIGTLADVVAGRRVRRGFAVVAAVVALGFVAAARLRLGPELESPARALANAVSGYPELRGLAKLELEQRLAAASPEATIALARETLAAAPPRGTQELARDRSLAVASALCGASDLAAELLQRAIATASATATAAERRPFELDLMDLLLRDGKHDSVIDECDELLAAESVGVQRSALLVRRAAAHVRRFAALAPTDQAARDQAWGEVTHSLDEAVRADPDSARAHFDRGRLAIVRGDGVRAVQDLERAARLAPHSPHPHLQLALFYLSRAQESPALASLARARAIAGPNDPEVLLLEAQRSIAIGDLEGAQSRARRLAPDSMRLLGGRSALSELYDTLARASDEARDTERAIDASRASLALVPDRDGGRTLVLAHRLEKALRYDEVITLLESARAAGITPPDLAETLSMAWKNEGVRQLANDRRRARDCFLAAVRESPRFSDLGTAPMLLRTLTAEFEVADDDVLAEAKRAYEFGAARADSAPSDAERALEVSLALVPGNPFAGFQLGRVKRQQGDASGARKLFDDALRAARELGATDLENAIRREIDRP